MGFHQDRGELLSSHPQLSIKHLLITASLTPACLSGQACPSCKHLARQFCSVTGEWCTGRNRNIGVQTIGKALPLSISPEKSKIMFSQGHCRPSIKKKNGRGEKKKWKGEEEIAEHPVSLHSCLHSAAEAVNSKALKHIGHHLRHPSFQKLPLFTQLSGGSTQFIAVPRGSLCTVTFGGDTRGPHKQPACALQYLKGMSPGLDSCLLKDIKGNNVFLT